jgi:Protein of unknown function (DUF3592)
MPYVASPPRSIPLTTSLKVLLSSIAVQLGFGLMLFGSIFIWTFGLLSNFGGVFNPAADAKAIGTVVAVEQTNTEVNNEYVYKNVVRFSTPDGTTYVASSYSNGTSVEVGDEVAVVYPTTKPSAVMIEGQRAGAMPGWVMLIVLWIPIGGLIVTVVGLFHNVGKLKLLAWGDYATGKLVSKATTGVTINDMPQYKLTYKVVVSGGRQFEAFAHAHRLEKLTNDAEEPLLYLPNVQGGYSAVVLDALPGNTSFDIQGNITAASPGEALWVLLLPLLLVAANALVVYFAYYS